MAPPLQPHLGVDEQGSHSRSDVLSAGRLDLLIEQLEDLYLVERVHESVEDIASLARSTDLKLHTRVSPTDRLEQSFLILKQPLQAMAVKQGIPAHERRVVACGPASCDAATAAAIELGDREIVAYLRACSLARDLGYSSIVRLLARSLHEHSRSNQRRDRIAGTGGRFTPHFR